MTEENLKFAQGPIDPFLDLEKEGVGVFTRRLYQVGYSCPLRLDTHTAEYYVSAVQLQEGPGEEQPEQDHDENARKMLKSQQFANPLTNAAIIKHQEIGEFLGLAAEALLGEKKKRPVNILDVRPTDEVKITCEHCGMTFDTIGAHRLHLGRDPDSLKLADGNPAVPQCANLN